MRGEEGAIVPAVRLQLVRKREHQRDVGVRPDRPPFDARDLDVGAQGTDIDDRAARRREALDAAAQPVPRRAAGADLHVLQRKPPERDEEPAVLLEHGPLGHAPDDLVHRHDDARHQRACGAEAVGPHVADIAAGAVHEAMHLADGVVEAPGARPAVRAGVDRLVAVRLPHAIDRAGDEVERTVPVDLDERVQAATPGLGTRAVFQHRAAHRRPAHAHAAVDGRGH